MHPLQKGRTKPANPKIAAGVRLWPIQRKTDTVDVLMIAIRSDDTENPVVFKGNLQKAAGGNHVVCKIFAFIQEEIDLGYDLISLNVIHNYDKTAAEKLAKSIKIFADGRDKNDKYVLWEECDFLRQLYLDDIGAKDNTANVLFSVSDFFYVYCDFPNTPRKRTRQNVEDEKKSDSDKAMKVGNLVEKACGEVIRSATVNSLNIMAIGEWSNEQRDEMLNRGGCKEMVQLMERGTKDITWTSFPEGEFAGNVAYLAATYGWNLYFKDDTKIMKFGYPARLRGPF